MTEKYKSNPLLVVLNDGETFSDIKDAKVLRVTRSGSDRVCNEGGNALDFEDNEILEEYFISDLLISHAKRRVQLLDEVLLRLDIK